MTFDRSVEVDLSIALKTLHDLAVREGDLGREYWGRITELLKDSASFKQRALAAEEKLRQAMLRAGSQRHSVRGVCVSLKECKRISREHPSDIARMQALLIAADRDYMVDEIISAWSSYSQQMGLAWAELPHSDEKLLLILLSTIALGSTPGSEQRRSNLGSKEEP